MKKIIDWFDGNYEFLSNFYNCTIAYEGLVYPSSEAAFQAAKCKNIEERKEFTTMNPGRAKRLGRRVEIREDWDAVRVDVMAQVLRIKFSDPILRQQLLDTQDAILMEGNSWNDTFWGVCQGVGENHLGKLLMQIRDEIREEQK